jgi:hypothetical protein
MIACTVPNDSKFLNLHIKFLNLRMKTLDATH